jgi:hypothetical protein
LTCLHATRRPADTRCHKRNRRERKFPHLGMHQPTPDSHSSILLAEQADYDDLGDKAPWLPTVMPAAGCQRFGYHGPDMLVLRSRSPWSQGKPRLTRQPLDARTGSLMWSITPWECPLAAHPSAAGSAHCCLTRWSHTRGSLPLGHLNPTAATMRAASGLSRPACRPHSAVGSSADSWQLDDAADTVVGWCAAAAAVDRRAAY